MGALRAGTLQTVGQSTAQRIDGGLRFDSGKSHYLSRTPSSAGNRKTWTWAGWVKRSGLGVAQAIFGEWNGSAADGFTAYFTAAEVLILQDYDGSFVESLRRTTTQVFRDVSAWYHIVVSVDTTDATADDRVKLYVNGSEVTTFSSTTNPTQNSDTRFNRAQATSIGRSGAYSASYYFPGYLADVHFIDGQALGPGYFGYTDPLTNTWRPKKFKPQATPNDGTTWSSYGSLSVSPPALSGTIADIFDGTIVQSGGSFSVNQANAGVTITFSPALPAGTTVKLIGDVYGTAGDNDYLQVNGTGYAQSLPASAGTTTFTVLSVPAGAGGISSIYLYREGVSTFNYALMGIEVDGVLLIDGDTSNIGLNGFNLPFDGSAPIGQDQSGRGNDWTPAKFGGSAALDKATGALPILNTDGGGKVARVGVREEIVRSSTPTAIQGTVAFDGSGDYLNISGTNSEFAFGTGDFTVEFFINTSNWDVVAYDSRPSTINGDYLTLYIDTNGALRWDEGGATRIQGSNGEITKNAWVHIAATREGTSAKLFVNGSQTGSTYTDSTDYLNATNRPFIGAQSRTEGGSAVNGFISNVRVIKGTALYTSNFTVPTAELTAVANTKLLCCQSPTSAGAAAVSPNISGINDGRVWSDANIGDPIRSGQHIDAIFDGDSSTGSETDNGTGKKLLFDFENTFGSIPVSSSIKVWIGGSDGRTLKVNGTTIATNANSASNPFTITNQSQLNSVEVVSESSTRSGFLRQISVDDVPLTNPVIRNGDAFATRSELSGSNVLALPLVGTKDDVSSLVKGGGSNKTVTSVNAVASYTQSNFYGGSWYFDGSGDYINSSSSDFGFSSGTPFTIEGWFYANSLPSSGDGSGAAIFGNREYVQSNSFTVYIGSSATNTIGIHVGSGSVTYFNSPGGLQTSTWNHIAMVRNSSNVVEFFVNGISIGTGSPAGDLSNGAIYIGCWGSGRGAFFNGYIQDLRIYKGVEKYTSNFIPASTNPDILPDSPSGVSYSSKLTKIIDGAVAFDGTGDYLSLANSSDLQFGSSDFTIELFVYRSNTSLHYLLAQNNGVSAAGSQYDMHILANSTINVNFYTGSSAISLAGGSVNANKWYHIAVTRSGSDFRLFVDGTLATSTTNSNALNSVSVDHLIGTITTGNTNKLNGFISNLRVIKGTALYTSNFTPPSAPLTNVTNTKLLCCQSNTQAGSAAVAPNVSGVNDGREWSHFTTASGGFNGSYPKYYLFDGQTPADSNRAEAASNDDPINIDFSPAITVSSTISLWSGKSSTRYQINNSGSYTTYSDAVGSYKDISHSGSLSNIKILHGSAGQAAGISAIKIDGTQLKDPASVIGDASATNFNPFTSDINAVRGQESGYATLNPLTGGATLSNGNLAYTTTANTATSTIGVTSGKYYAEVNCNDGGGAWIGITNNPNERLDSVDTNTIAVIDGDGDSYNPSSTQTYTNYSGFTSGDTIGIALDATNGTLDFYVNNTKVKTYNSFTVSGPYFFGIDRGAAVTQIFNWNFGQKPFKYAPPEGFQPLTLANLQRPSIVRPDQYVGVTTYTGNGSTQTISGLGFSPDLVWIKARNAVNTLNRPHQLFDTVRGAPKALSSNRADTEDASGGYDNDGALTAFTSNGFTVESGPAVGNNGSPYVAWAWKAGGNSNTFNIDNVGYDTASAAGLDSGSITPTGASVNTKSGFSIITYTGTGSAATVAHGLGEAPQLIIAKARTATEHWQVGHTSIGWTKRLFLSTTAATDTSTAAWNDTAPTSTVFSIGNSGNINNITTTYVAYCWAEIPGFSKFGSYTSNNSSDGVVVNLGFRPSVVLIKLSGGAGNPWLLFDSVRNSFNLVTNKLAPNSSVAENDATIGTSSENTLDFLSNGFKFRTANTGTNGPANTYIYAAWAEAPSINLYGAQANAR